MKYGAFLYGEAKYGIGIYGASQQPIIITAQGLNSSIKQSFAESEVALHLEGEWLKMASGSGNTATYIVVMSEGHKSFSGSSYVYFVVDENGIGKRSPTLSEMEILKYGTILAVQPLSVTISTTEYHPLDVVITITEY